MTIRTDFDTTPNRAYVAGLFDGDGCIRICHTKGKDGKRGQYFLECKITNAYWDVLSEIQEIFGGSINQHTRRKEHWRDGWVWRIGTKQAKKFIEAVYPFLRIKKTEASIALQFSNTLADPNTWNVHRVDIPEKIMQLREDYKQVLQELKQINHIPV